MQKTEVMVEFNLFGEKVHFDEITSLLNVIPTEICRKEECKIAEFAKDSWTFSTGYKEVLAISIPFEQMVDMFSMKIEVINHIKERLDLESNIVIVIKSDVNRTPEVVLTNKCVQFASNTNCEIHFDNYFFAEE